MLRTRPLSRGLEPIEAFQRLSRTYPHAFLVEPIRNARGDAFSVLGFDPDEFRVDAAGADPLDTIRDLRADAREASAELPFTGGVVGALSYDAVRSFSYPHHAGNPPHGLLGLYPDAILYDHQAHAYTYATHDKDRSSDVYSALKEPLEPKEPRVGPPRSSHGPEEFTEMVEAAQHYISDGDAYQVVLSRELQGSIDGDPFGLLPGLPKDSGYRYAFDLGATRIVGASPEPLLRVRGRVAEVVPIAGTRPRAATVIEDARQARRLRQDEKEQAEHLMLVDLARNDLGRVSTTGSIRVPRFMTVRSYETVHHLVSRVTGTLRREVDALDALASVFPAGTVTGAPKLRAMEIIDRLEATPRGLYGGCLGLFGFDGSLETILTIRTLVATQGSYTVRAGAGIVHDSRPEREFEETAHKAASVLGPIEVRA